MQEVLALALQSMQSDMQRLDRIGTNLANALTPGYQREVAAARPLAFASVVGAMERTATAAGTGAPSIAPAPGLMIRTDSRPGSLRSTGQGLDVALAGPGFFEVSTPEGPAYTRQGDFRLDGQGRLVTAMGHPVMGRGGEIYPGSATPRIDAAGNLLAPEGSGAGAALPLAQLKIMQPEGSARMAHTGNGLMRAEGAVALVPEADVQVRQGYLENSNVSSMQEMVQLVQTMRHFESMQKVALGYDEMTGQAIRKLGELS
ncbi:flagellar hook-basal body protein [Paracidovorax cattleyae]|uniref:Flagellar basal-body rod protein FlgG n=2 Tax=Paracidovorax cattleyae TaxID=80868 RepID=A0A1H0U8B0_9BURK|nr:flagellar hook basal-body protein [Paracidovorax cattleyae]AVS74652.1 flagellar hook basal-body protein [Paracidovorax cattleyae]SDP62399.1 flagellar basal-body rod protein FlgG [Paracidovorax cattleyae]